MIDPLQRIAPTPEGTGTRDGSPEPTLFDAPSRPTFPTHAEGISTSTLAGEQAARGVGRMQARILERLRQSPATLFEVALHLGVPDHVISGRFTELARDMKIDRTGERRPKPESGCLCDVWRICE